MEHERQLVACEAQKAQLQQELASQKQQASLLNSQLSQLSADHAAATNAAAAEQAKAASAATELRTQFAGAQHACELAMQAVAQAEIDCESRLALLQEGHERQLAAAAGEAAAKLAGQQEAAAAHLAACEAALQLQLAEAVAAGHRELQQQREQQEAAAAAAAAQWDRLCSQLALKLQQLAANIASDAKQVHLSLGDAALPTLQQPGNPAGRHGEGSGACGSSSEPAAALPAMAAVYDALRQLYGAALEARSLLASSQLRESSLQQMLDGLRRTAAEEKQRWQQRLQRDLRQQDVAWDVKCSEQLAAAEVTARARLAEVEAQLNAELAQVTANLGTAQHSRQELERQCIQLASDLLAAQQAAAAGLEAARTQAAEQQRQVEADAAAAARDAALRQEASEQALRQDMQAALAGLEQRHAEAIQVLARQHEQQLDEARLLADQAAQHHAQASRFRGAGGKGVWRFLWPQC